MSKGLGRETALTIVAAQLSPKAPHDFRQKCLRTLLSRREECVLRIGVFGLACAGTVPGGKFSETEPVLEPAPLYPILRNEDENRLLDDGSS